MVERELAAGGVGEVTLSEEYQRLARREGVAGGAGVAGVLIVVAIFLMVTKPGA